MYIRILVGFSPTIGLDLSFSSSTD
jgi:hypothetical protein